jgi:L-rhamnose mutarotase
MFLHPKSYAYRMQKHVQSLRKFDNIVDVEFKLSNEMFKSVMTLLKRSGKANVQGSDVISHNYSMFLDTKNNIVYSIFQSKRD